MSPRTNPAAFAALVLLLALGCKKKTEGGETEPSDPNRCTYAAPDVTCPEGTFCFVPAKELTGKDPSTAKIWGTCQKKRGIGEECESADDCENASATCDSAEPGGKSVCALDEEE
jgi:hypothetical protein